MGVSACSGQYPSIADYIYSFRSALNSTLSGSFTQFILAMFSMSVTTSSAN